MHTSILSDQDFGRLSPTARATFLLLPILAGNCDAGGALTSRSGPTTVAEIASYSGLSVVIQRKAVAELVACGFLVNENGCLRIANWERHQVSDVTAADRQRKSRDKKRSAERDVTRDSYNDVTDTVTPENREDKNREEESGAAPTALPPPRSRKDPEKYDDAFYAKPVQAFVDKRLFECGPEERRAIARLFAFRFSNARAAGVVESRATAVAKTLVGICADVEHGQLTVRQWFAASKSAVMAARTPQQIEKNLPPAPTYDPWIFKTALVVVQ